MVKLWSYHPKNKVTVRFRVPIQEYRTEGSSIVNYHAARWPKQSEKG